MLPVGGTDIADLCPGAAETLAPPLTDLRHWFAASSSVKSVKRCA